MGTGGAIFGVTLAAFGPERTAFVCTSAWIDLGVDLTRSLVYVQQGFVDARVWTRRVRGPGARFCSVCRTSGSGRGC